jgi:hypothetical protein
MVSIQSFSIMAKDMAISLADLWPSGWLINFKVYKFL